MNKLLQLLTFPADKIAHFIAGQVAALAALLAAIVLLPDAGATATAALGILAATVAGVGKEVYDDRTPGHVVDVLDAVATAAGGAFLSAVILISSAAFGV